MKIGFASLALGASFLVPFVGDASAATASRPIVRVDVRHDLLIDPISVEAAISPRTKAIMPVHFTGNVCEMSSLLAIGERHAIPIIEDAAQAFGASFRGRKVGTFGPLGCFSMNPMKMLNALIRPDGNDRRGRPPVGFVAATGFGLESVVMVHLP